MKDGQPAIRNQANNNGPVKDYNPETGEFFDKPNVTPKPDIMAQPIKATAISHADIKGVDVDVEGPDGRPIQVNAIDKMKELELRRQDAQRAKQRAQAAGNKEAADAANQEMVRASEQLGEVAADAYIKKIAPNATRLRSEMPGRGKSGEFDRVYQDGDKVYIVEAKGGESSLGSRKTKGGDRAQQGTPEYRNSVVEEMQDRLDKVAERDDFNLESSPNLVKQVEELEDTLKTLRKAIRSDGRASKTGAQTESPLQYLKVSQRLREVRNHLPAGERMDELRDIIEVVLFSNRHKGN